MLETPSGIVHARHSNDLPNGPSCFVPFTPHCTWYRLLLSLDFSRILSEPHLIIGLVGFDWRIGHRQGGEGSVPVDASANLPGVVNVHRTGLAGLDAACTLILVFSASPFSCPRPEWRLPDLVS